MKDKQWYGGNICDFCHKQISDFLVDGKTNIGPWACMCKQCYEKYGVGIAPGLGQLYKENKKGIFIKIDG